MYLYTLSDDYQYATGKSIAKPVLFSDERGTAWLMIDEDGVMTIAAGYSHDGCSPKYVIRGRVVGIPDGKVCPFCQLPETYYASLVHDVLCQFAEHPDMPWPRAEIDEIFHDVMRRDKFKWAGQYNWGVVNLGPIHKRIEQVFN